LAEQEFVGVRSGRPCRGGAIESQPAEAVPQCRRAPAAPAGADDHHRRKLGVFGHGPSLPVATVLRGQ